VVDPLRPNQRCMHIAAGDGYITAADGKLQYIFGFKDVTGVAEAMVQQTARMEMQFPAPTIAFDEGDELYLTLSNVGFAERPDLFDAHTVHYHGFPNAAPVFDGEPEASFGVNVDQSFTFYYRFVEPGTYLYHCHMEATEHMQMGMLGNAYIRPRQNKLPPGTTLGTHVHAAGDQYVYNDGDGSTRYDVEVPLQISGFDSRFHDASNAVQPLPFAMMEVDYAMMNGRGYPDSANPSTALSTIDDSGRVHVSQTKSALVTAQAGKRILLRLSNVDVTRYYTVASPSIPMTVVGKGARILRGEGKATGKTLFHDVSSVHLGGGETADVILDTTGVPPGTYFLHTTNLNYLSNGAEDLGGLMTEIVLTN
jgi:FtsP/CotA-like multicopper oxidase with cupredoxin domain